MQTASNLNHPVPPDITRGNGADFLKFLDEKLQRHNDRIRARLIAWAELLDIAGWCVAISDPDTNPWLSQGARIDLIKRGHSDPTWANLIMIWENIPHTARHLATDAVRIWAAGIKNPQPPSTPDLTPREAEVWSWIKEGKTGFEIAIILHCAPRTIEKHISNLYRKIGVRNRTAAILAN